MYQLYALGAMIAVGFFFHFLVNAPTLLSDSKSVRDSIYLVMKTSSRDVHDALEVGARHCVGNVYYQNAPRYFKEVAVAAYLSTMRIPGVPSGKPPSDEALRKQMDERIEVSWKAAAKKDQSYSEKEREFFDAIRSFHGGNKKVDECVFSKANEYLTEKGLIQGS
jgi:hypothetical protein